MCLIPPVAIIEETLQENVNVAAIIVEKMLKSLAFRIVPRRLLKFN